MWSELKAKLTFSQADRHQGFFRLPKPGFPSGLSSIWCFTTSFSGAKSLCGVVGHLFRNTVKTIMFFLKSRQMFGDKKHEDLTWWEGYSKDFPRQSSTH